jgi:hypothetical protein
MVSGLPDTLGPTFLSRRHIIASAQLTVPALSI